MLVVVPGEEAAQMNARLLEALEALRKFGPVLERLELRLRERVVVGYAWPREARRHAEVDQKLRGVLRPHGAATIRMQRKRVARDVVFAAGLLDQRVGGEFVV